MDLYSRGIVGWALRDYLRAELGGLADDHLGAVALHRPDPSFRSRRSICLGGVSPSDAVCRPCNDNAPMEERFFHTLKTELVYHRHYATRGEGQRDIFAYIEGFYNRTRRRSAIGYISHRLRWSYEQLNPVDYFLGRSGCCVSPKERWLTSHRTNYPMGRRFSAYLASSVTARECLALIADTSL